MSRAAKVTLAASLVVSATTVWAVHYMQIQEREVSKCDRCVSDHSPLLN